MHDIVKDYYGHQLQHSDDLKTSACCDPSLTPAWLKPLLARVHPEVTARYYGCGLVCPPLLEGCRVLDLGCGAGRDVYVLAQLVGEHGHVLGVDMTEEQLAVAERHHAYHSELFGFDNVSFAQGYIESLDEIGLASASFDVIVSNCVVNLSPDKQAVLREVYRLLKPGGEFYFSDVYADRRVPESVRNDPVLYGECLGGALYWNDFLRLAQRHGFADPRLVTDRPLVIDDAQLAEKAGSIRFYSATYRLFKLDGLENACEDYGQAVIYRGTVPHHPHRFMLDKHHDIEAGRVFPVCGNTWRMLHDSRFGPHFDFIGDFTQHYGLFEGCGSTLPFSRESVPVSSACC
ncbi:methyltransferase domain-containing protein [Pseudogulbenkiania subflava]|uniref:Arsenite methyltransferase n=1 Tax=Pseudogulbenkiania subflava DSM 22618 TaxID=1123014 RepID=A0A1Y6C6D6_9NEIS|nr:methyltransferase domain-containing protein [Pseudogulbenkiania subflava]SMF23289.1 Methyltransferase domain-containing protein [Pseudogulbenkiania subflava DSM 22618]SMF32638.1 Methyltransferase domain-containing protein [Pseudogulbenkiania subflava DSM 22618]SMF47680.1 Methyltransferase domain-containing protein [Pseudogulbenkiania subflava DSM 22618]